jgi:cytochrome P450
LRFKRALAAMDRIIYRIIDKRMKFGQKPRDILTLFIGDNPADVDIKQVRDEVITMMLAGHDTTAHALSYCLYLIGKNARVLNNLDDEHQKILKGQAPQWENIKDLNYTKMTFYEAMRLFPPAWAVSRFCSHPLQFDGYSFAANTTYFLPQYAMHRHPRYWPHPEQFIPERFTKEEIAARPKYAYFPFGGGPRVCIGQALATLEAQVILPMLLQQFTFTPDSQFSLNPRITLSPTSNIKLKKVNKATTHRQKKC